MSLNKRKIWQGGVAGGVVWIVWSLVINMAVIGRSRYEAMQSAGLFLKHIFSTNIARWKSALLA